MKSMKSKESKKYEGDENNKERSVKGMKNFFKKIRLIAVLVAFLGGTGVTMAALTENPVMAHEYVYKSGAETGYTIPKEITIKKGETKTITLTTPAGSKDVTNVAWGYQTNDYFTVLDTNSGSYWGKPATITIKGVSPGIGRIDADAEVLGKKGVPDSYKYTAESKCVVKVIDGNAKPAKYPLQKITLDKGNQTLNEGQSATLKVNYTLANTTDSKTVNWSSSNTSVATVSGGRVTAKKAGTATITARVGSKTATCKIVVNVPLKSVSLNKTSITLNQGNSYTLTCTPNPSNATDRSNVTWISNNTSVATVSGGKVVTKKEGTATITARMGSKTATCKVTVKRTGGTASVPAGTSVKEGYLNVSQAYTLTNSFRTTRSNQWYWNKDNKTKTYTYGLKSLTRDTTLENIAKQRAKEQWTQYYVNKKTTHNRPNGSSCWTAYTKGSNPCGENLGWGDTTCSGKINGWAETNKKYDGQGHRRNMLSYEAKRVGIACYVKDGKTCWAMCLGR